MNKSFGMQITQDRIELINHSLNQVASVELQDAVSGKDHTGTKVILRLPKITMGMKEAIEATAVTAETNTPPDR